MPGVGYTRLAGGFFVSLKSRRGLRIGIMYYTFQFVFGGSLDRLLDLVVGDRFLRAHSEIHHGDIRCRDPEGHASEFAIQRRDHLTHGLRGSGAAGDDILRGGPSASPVFRRRTVHGLLGCSVRVDRSHQAFHNAKIVIDDLGQGGEAVRRAGSHRKDVYIWLVL